MRVRCMGRSWGAIRVSVRVAVDWASPQRTSAAPVGPRNAVRVHFQNGRIYDSDVTGAREIYGPILNRYDHTGGARGRLGLPTTGIFKVTGGLRSNFQHGSIRWDRSSNRTTIQYN